MAGVVVALAVLVAWPGRPRRRWRLLVGRPSTVRVDPAWIAAVVVPVAALILLGPVGAVVGAVVAPVVHRHVAAMATAAQARRQADLLRQAPLALDLLAAVLAAGRSAEESVRAVAGHTAEPLRTELRAVATRLTVSTDVVAAWRTLDGTVLEPVGRAFARSDASGAAIVPLVADAADDLRRAARAQRRAEVARIGVRSTLPMGLCLLPAFVLVAVAPTVLAVVTSLGH